MTDTPFLSLAVIVGDSGVGTLPRMLKSVLERSTGPMVDEIVICWNGTDDAKWYAAMGREALLPAEVGGITEFQTGDVLTRLVRQKWPGRFDVARNESFRYARGEWVIWADTDDVIADAGKDTPDDLPAIERCEGDYGIAPPAKDAPSPPSLKQWLKGLPWNTNCVFAPYDYTIDTNGYVVIRQKMKRIVRKNANYIWWSPEQSGIHEYLYPLGNMAEVSVETFGLLFRHHPTESDLEKAKRNRDIVFGLTEKPSESAIQTGRHQYDLANSFVTIGALEKADEAIKAAIQNAQSYLDTYTYRLARAALCTMRGQHQAALGEAFAAIGTLPELQDAYFVATESFFLLGKWDSVVQFYELGRSKKPTLLSKDQPLYCFVQPRCQAAMAWGNLGEPEKGLLWAQEAVAQYPKSEMAREALAKVVEAINRKKVIAAYLDLSEFAVEKGEVSLAENLLISPPFSLRGVEAIPRYRALVERLSAIPLGARAPTDVQQYVEKLEHRGVLLESAEQDGLRVKVVEKGPALFNVGFYCPHAMEQWWPRSLYDKGLGGSESSVAYLARELFKLGVRVTTYTPHGDAVVRSVRDGIIERELSTFSPRLISQHDVLVSCRAPWVVRNTDLPKDLPIWVWHQDNSYGNPWTWSPETDKRIALNLHVSEWAMRGLLNECYGKNELVNNHVVLGNGFPPECRDDWPSERPLRVISASDPSRGLAQLLDAWPFVHAKEPDATLHVYCSFRVSYALAQNSPGMPQFGELRALEMKLRKMSADPSSGVTYFEWATQKEVIAEMKQARVYCYPGGPMPEGYGVALVQAQAAGCVVMAPRAGALPEVLDGGETVWLTAGAGELAEAILVGLREFTRPVRVDNDKHLWSNVAKRFFELLTERVPR